jgi:diguanylate cyclase (GGDEF)-like protein
MQQPGTSLGSLGLKQLDRHGLQPSPQSLEALLPTVRERPWTMMLAITLLLALVVAERIGITGNWGLLGLLPLAAAAWSYRKGPALAIAALATVFLAGGFSPPIDVNLPRVLLSLVVSTILFAWARHFRALLEREHREARTDGLTGAMSPRGFREVLRRELGLANKQKHALALIYIDLDHFKDINDRFGHDAGDTVLCDIVDRLVGTLLGQDHVARLGGDEFIVLLRYVDGESTITRFRSMFESILDACKHPLTASVGAVIVNPGSGLAEGDLIARTDRLMYEIKHSGKAGLLFETVGEFEMMAAAA